MTRLTGEALADFVERLSAASPLHAPLLAEYAFTVDPIEVPAVLGDVTAQQVTIELRHRPVELRVVDVDGELVLVGSPDAANTLSRRLELHLAEPDDAADYLRFWCRVALRRAEHLVESRGDFRWIPGVTSDPDLRARADRAAHLARRVAVGHPAGGAFPAEITALDDRTLELRRLRVGGDGHVDEIDRLVLMTDVPVPYTVP